MLSYIRQQPKRDRCTRTLHRGRQADDLPTADLGNLRFEPEAEIPKAGLIRSVGRAVPLARSKGYGNS